MSVFVLMDKQEGYRLPQNIYTPQKMAGYIFDIHMKTEKCCTYCSVMKKSKKNHRILRYSRSWHWHLKHIFAAEDDWWGKILWFY